jgi:hypothetical protein
VRARCDPRRDSGTGIHLIVYPCIQAIRQPSTLTLSDGHPGQDGLETIREDRDAPRPQMWLPSRPSRSPARPPSQEDVAVLWQAATRSHSTEVAQEVPSERGCHSMQVIATDPRKVGVSEPLHSAEVRTSTTTVWPSAHG